MSLRKMWMDTKPTEEPNGRTVIILAALFILGFAFLCVLAGINCRAIN